MDRYSDKTVLISGASSGIGQATALRMASEGANLALIDINLEGLHKTADLAKKYGGRIEVEKCDVSNFEEVGLAIGKLASAFKTINALSHNAGILKSYNTHEMTIEQWNEIININLNGTFSVNKHSLIHLLKNDVSYICNMSSIADFHPHPWLSAYSASKGAIRSFTKSLFLEYYRQGLHANCVQPGSISSDLSNGFAIPYGADEDLINYLVPYGKSHLVAPEHAASVIAMLCSDDASHINGTEIVIDGGRV